MANEMALLKPSSQQEIVLRDVLRDLAPHAIPVVSCREARRFRQSSARSRLLTLGPQALSDVELLSLLLHPGGRRRLHDVAANLLTLYGSLRTLLVADRHAAAAHGLTLCSYAALQAALEIARRHYQELMMAGSALNNPRASREYLRMRLRDRPYEVFAVLYLDSRHRVIHWEELFRGTIDGASVHPREVVKNALARNAGAVIVAHNHPSGVAEPSQADELITGRLKAALALVDIRLLDHLIIADDRVESFSERGLL